MTVQTRRPPQERASGSHARQTGLCAFTAADVLLLGNDGHDRNDGIGENASGVYVLLTERPPLDAVVGQPSEIGESRKHALA
jgi:hypothetical protein